MGRLRGTVVISAIAMLLLVVTFLSFTFAKGSFSEMANTANESTHGYSCAGMEGFGPKCLWATPVPDGKKGAP